MNTRLIPALLAMLAINVSCRPATRQVSFHVPSVLNRALGPDDELFGNYTLIDINDPANVLADMVELDLSSGPITVSIEVSPGTYELTLEWAASMGPDATWVELLLQRAELEVEKRSMTRVDLNDQSDVRVSWQKHEYDQDMDGWSNLDELLAGQDPLAFVEFDWRYTDPDGDWAGWYIYGINSLDLDYVNGSPNGFVVLSCHDCFNPSPQEIGIVSVVDDAGNHVWTSEELDSLAVDMTRGRIFARPASYPDEIVAVDVADGATTNPTDSFDWWLTAEPALATDGALWFTGHKNGIGYLVRVEDDGTDNLQVSTQDYDSLGLYWSGVPEEDWCDTNRNDELDPPVPALQPYDETRLLFRERVASMYGTDEACSVERIGLLDISGTPSVTWTHEALLSPNTVVVDPNDGRIYALTFAGYSDTTAKKVIALDPEISGDPLVWEESLSVGNPGHLNVPPVLTHHEDTGTLLWLTTQVEETVAGTGGAEIFVYDTAVDAANRLLFRRPLWTGVNFAGRGPVVPLADGRVAAMGNLYGNVIGDCPRPQTPQTDNDCRRGLMLLDAENEVRFYYVSHSYDIAGVTSNGNGSLYLVAPQPIDEVDMDPSDSYLLSLTY